jgi:adenylate cyclase
MANEATKDAGGETEKTPLQKLMAAISGPILTLGIALGVTLLSMLWDVSNPARLIENLTYDMRMASTAFKAQDDIVIVKMDDASMFAMQDASECRCLSPVDKVWLGEVVRDLSQKGAKAIALDILLSGWRTEEERQEFTRQIAGLPTPIIAAVDPSLRPGIDYQIVPNLKYASPNSLVAREDDVVRQYDPKPDGMASLASALAEVYGANVPKDIFTMRYRSGLPDDGSENRGAIAPSFPAALVKDLPAEMFAGKTVLIGRVTRFAKGQSGILEDMHSTPLRFMAGHADGTPGVEVHAHALSQMRQGDQLNRPGMLWTALTVLIAALGGAALGLSSFRLWVAAVVVLGAVVAVGFAAFGALSYFGLMVGLLAPVTAFALSFFIQSRLATTQLQQERKLYSTALERYLAPQVIKRIEDGSEPVQIGAQMKEVTMMVSDIENFSGLVASTPIREFEMIINGYFDGLYDVLWKHEAMLDKLTGDGLIAMFGAPIEHKDHADRAIACARDMETYTEAYRDEVEKRFNIRMGRTRIGLHSGEGLVGNFGGEKRFNYTAYGQVVVIAARLEAANKEAGTGIMFSDATLKLAKNPGPVREVGSIQLKGVPQPILTYTTSLT